MSHGVAQGGLTEAQGGQFRHGFYAGFASSAAGGTIQEMMPDTVTGRTAAAAIVGGTASALGGGKFANGAVSGAFTHLFNNEAHLEARQDRLIKGYMDGKYSKEYLFEVYEHDALIAGGELLGMGIGAVLGRAAMWARGLFGIQKLATGFELTAERLAHITNRHWFGSAATNAGKFAEGTSEVALRDMIGETLARGAARPNTGGRIGQIFEYNFARPIGTNLSGDVATKLRVVITPERKIVTAFPF